LPKNNESISAIPLVHLLCRSIDTKQLCTLVGEIIRENFTLLDGPKFFTQLVNQSLKWDSFSQIIIWNLFQAEGLTMDWVIASGIIPKISYEKYPEGMN
jgi:hypothetical protein